MELHLTAVSVQLLRPLLERIHPLEFTLHDYSLAQICETCQYDGNPANVGHHVLMLGFVMPGPLLVSSACFIYQARSSRGRFFLRGDIHFACRTCS
jgi:hypothetical protein